MNKALRKAIVAGNWKMNNDRKAARELIGELTPMVKDAACEVVLCVPYTNLETALSLCEGTNLHIGAENCHWAKSGAFTGEISAQMLAEMGVEYVIIGHSERRQYFGETDQTVNARIRAALDAGLKVILCVGEVLEQRELGVTEEVVSMQTKIALGGVSEQELAKHREELDALIAAVRQREVQVRTRSIQRYETALRVLRANPSAKAKAELGEAFDSLRKLLEK